MAWDHFGRFVLSNPCVCSNCFQLVYEEDEPPEAWAEARRWGEINGPEMAGPKERPTTAIDLTAEPGERRAYDRYEHSTDAVTTYRSPNPRTTGRDGEGTFCEACGALDPFTVMREDVGKDDALGLGETLHETLTAEAIAVPCHKPTLLATIDSGFRDHEWSGRHDTVFSSAVDVAALVAYTGDSGLAQAVQGRIEFSYTD